MGSANLDSFFKAKTIAVIGASNDPTRIGGRPIHYSAMSGFQGEIYPVNPKYKSVFGLECYPSLEELPTAVDLAIVAVAAKFLPRVVEDAARAGTKALVVFSSGYAEVDDTGLSAQTALSYKVIENGMLLLGPNCLGVINTESGLMATFTATLDSGLLPKGNIGFACQSGAFGSFFLALARKRGLGVHFWAGTGNESMVTVADCIEYYSTCDEIKVIAGYVEGVQSAANLAAALRSAHSAGKPVVLLKVGKSEVGGRAALSHTGSLVGDDAAFTALLERYGAYRARSVDELIDIADACSLGAYPQGKRLCIMTMSGGAGILMADAAIELGLSLPEPTDAIQRELKELLPYSAVQNPVDFTGQFLNDSTLASDFLNRMVGKDAYDAYVTFLGHTSLAESLAQGPLTTIVELAKSSRTPQFVVGMMSDNLSSLLREGNVVAFSNPERMIALVNSMAQIQEALRTPIDDGTPFMPIDARKIMETLADEYSVEKIIPEAESLGFLAALGISTILARRAATPEDAAKVASEIGFPVVLKIESPQVLHKSHVGGVYVGLHTPAGVQAAGFEMLGKVSAHVPGAQISGFLVQPMYQGGLELIVGAKRDPFYGPVVMVGTGGVLAEAISDLKSAIAPLNYNTARSLLSQTAVGKAILDGRFTANYSSDPIIELLVKVSRAIAFTDQIAEIDMNPVRLTESPSDAIALDAMIILT